MLVESRGKKKPQNWFLDLLRVCHLTVYVYTHHHECCALRAIYELQVL